MSDLSPKLHMGQASTAGPRARNEDFYGAISDERISFACRRLYRYGTVFDFLTCQTY